MESCIIYGLSAALYGEITGADPAGELGEEHDPEPHPIPLALEDRTSGASDGRMTADGTGR